MVVYAFEQDIVNDSFVFVEKQTRERLPRNQSEWAKMYPEYAFEKSRARVYKRLIEELQKEIEWLEG